MNVFKLRKVVDILTIVLLIIVMSLLPMYIVNSIKLYNSVTNQVNDINFLFKQLEESHKVNAKLLYEALEFRRTEYNCYLSKESPDFLKIMYITLNNYSKYVTTDDDLTLAQKTEYLNHINKIQDAVYARKILAEKILEYDNNREYFINHFEK